MIKKNNYKNIKSTKNTIFENQQYICFYDSEFNAYDDRKDLTYPQEVISIGLCIVDKNSTMIYKYYTLVKLKKAKGITNRCREITGLTNKDMKDAKPFVEVCEKLEEIFKKYKIKKVFCYGTEDKRIFLKTAELYGDKIDINFFDKKFLDIRQEFKSKTKNQLGDQGLTFLKKVCKIEGETTHNALNDAIDLSQVFNVIYNVGYDRKLYEILSKEREDTSNYKRSRNIRDGQKVVAPIDVIKARDKIVKFLRETEIRNLNDGIRYAMADDLIDLIIKQN